MKAETVLALAATAAAQSTVGPWGQCGGIGYTGSTQCSTGWHCQEQNPYYFQCLEGAASTTNSAGTSTTSTSMPNTTTTTKSSTTTTTTTTAATNSTTSSSQTTSTGGVTCPGSFNKLSAEEYVQAMNPGWNLGNTLDATPDEGSWNNPPVQAETFAQVKAAGFKSVRIPVTYGYHYTSDAPDYTINSTWLDRVSEVVDMAVDAGLYVLTNVHHDSWIWADITSGADKDMVRAKFNQTWLQIGTKLACKSSMVAFETINEPPANTQDDADFINELNEIFLSALEASGGFNTDRVVTLVGASMDATKTSEWFVPPAEVKNPWALQYHYYSPYDFIFSAWGKTTWGADSEVATLQNELSLVPGNFSVPLVIGEFDASQINCEPAARWKWFEAVVEMAQKSDTALMVWDNGLDNLDRDTGVWRDPVSVEIMVKEGQKNSLPDATTDLQATKQDSSAYVFHKVGDAVADYPLTFTLNGNTLSSITTSAGSKLSSSDYSVSGSVVTLSSSFLSSYLSSSTPGVKETLTFHFSAGASPEVQIVVWDVPTFPSTTSKAVTGSDLTLSITTKGIDRVAAAKMVLADGTYMFDTWTQYLGPLQKARSTWNSQFYYENGVLSIRQAVVDATIAANQDAILTFEFYPRVSGNNVTYTLTV